MIRLWEKHRNIFWPSKCEKNTILNIFSGSQFGKFTVCSLVEHIFIQYLNLEIWNKPVIPKTLKMVLMPKNFIKDAIKKIFLQFGRRNFSPLNPLLSHKINDHRKFVKCTNSLVWKVEPYLNHNYKSYGVNKNYK